MARAERIKNLLKFAHTNSFFFTSEVRIFENIFLYLEFKTTAMRISDILDETVVRVNLKGKSKDEVISQMIAIVNNSPKVQDIEKVREAIFEREKIMSTGVGNGFAIPHGKTDAVLDIVAAFAITEEPIDYESLDEQPVRLIFLLVGKDSMVGPHIKLLSRISRLMNKVEFRSKLIEAKTPKEIIDIFKTEEATYFES